MYFTFVFGSKPLSPHALAERLLVAEIAETVSSPADGEVHMSRRYEKLVQTIRRAEQVAEMSRALADGQLRVWAQKHPLHAAKLAGSVLVRSATTADNGESSEDEPEHDDGDLATRMSQIVADINESVAGRQVLNAIQHAREQDMYQPHYLASEPYLRLTLRKLNFGLSSVSDNGEEDDGQSGDPLLLVHRSGDCSSPSRFGCHTDSIPTS